MKKESIDWEKPLQTRDGLCTVRRVFIAKDV